jgi:hypothetical protein
MRMRAHVHPSHLLAPAAALLLACSSPTAMCACPPARTHGVAEGVVSTAAGAPVAGAEIRVSLYRERCGAGPAEPADWGAAPARTDASGRYEARFFSIHGPSTACLRVAAARPAGADSAVAEGATLALVNERETPGRVRVDLVFP